MNAPETEILQIILDATVAFCSETETFKSFSHQLERKEAHRQELELKGNIWRLGMKNEFKDLLISVSESSATRK